MDRKKLKPATSSTKTGCKKAKQMNPSLQQTASSKTTQCAGCYSDLGAGKRELNKMYRFTDHFAFFLSFSWHT
jgi:hypothetical protein